MPGVIIGGEHGFGQLVNNDGSPWKPAVREKEAVNMPVTELGRLEPDPGGGNDVPLEKKSYAGWIVALVLMAALGAAAWYLRVSL